MTTRIAFAFSGNVRRAMRPDARVLVLEAPLPSDDSPGPGRWLDLQVMVLCGGRERTLEEYAALFEQSPGFALPERPDPASGDDRDRSGGGGPRRCEGCRPIASLAAIGARMRKSAMADLRGRGHP